MDDNELVDEGPALRFLELRGRPGCEGRTYVLARSQGYCEVCGFAADACEPLGDPPAATCPLCRERFGELEPAAAARIARVEAALDDGRLLVVTAAVITDGTGRVLVAERERSAHGGRAWEFPGGKVEPGETLGACLQREIEEELAVRLGSPVRFYMVDHTYERFDIRLCTLTATIRDGRLALRDHLDVRWVPAAHVDRLALSGADVDVARILASTDRV